MPWTTAGDLILSPNQYKSVAVSLPAATYVGFRIVGSTFTQPSHAGYLSVYTQASLSDGVSIEYLLNSISCWWSAGYFTTTPNGGGATLKRLGFKRTWGSTGNLTVRLYYFTP